jgi:hypothetical protein
VTLWLLPLRFSAAFRENWRRILAGAFLGWLVSSLVGAVSLAYFAADITLATSNLIGAAVVWSGLALGGVLGYATRCTCRKGGWPGCPRHGR